MSIFSKVGKFLTSTPVLNLADTAINSLFGMSQVKKQNDMQMQNWYNQQDYNSPSKQMERLRDAGLNPNLVYGQSSGNVAGNTSPAPEMSRYMGKISNLSAMYSLQLQKEQVENAKVQNDVLRSVVDRNSAETKRISYTTDNILPLQKLQQELQNVGKHESNEIAAINRQFLVNTFSQRLQQYNIHTDNLRLNNEMLNFTVNKLLPLREIASRVGIKLKRAQISQIKSQILLNIKRGNLLDIQADQFGLNYQLDLEMKETLKKLGAAGKVAEIATQLLKVFLK